MGKPEPACSCGHDRQQHDRNGCTDWDLKTNKPCTCKRKFMDMRGKPR